MWDIEAGILDNRFDIKASNLWNIAFAPDGKSVFLSMQDRDNVGFYAFKSGNRITNNSSSLYKLIEYGVWCADISVDGFLIALSNFDDMNNFAAIYDIKGDKIIKLISPWGSGVQIRH